MDQENSKNLCQLVASNIKAERLRLGMTQEGLASLTGFSLRFISRLESDPQNLRLDKLEKFSVALGVSPTDLVRDEDMSPHVSTLADQFKTALNSMHSIYERCFSGQAATCPS